MARARFIRPEYFTDEKIGGLSFGARILFPALWCHADLRGIFESAPKQIAALVFPFDDDVDSAKVSGWLAELENAGLIRLGVVDGKRYGLVINFERHQRISTSEEKIGTKRPTPKSLVPGTKVGTETSTKVGTEVGTETASISLSPSPTPTPTPTHTLSPARDPHVRDEMDIMGDPEPKTPTAAYSAPMGLPTRLREPWREIAEAHGEEVAEKALTVSKKHFGAPTEKQLLAVYQHNVELGNHLKPAEQWTDFRKTTRESSKQAANPGPRVREWFVAMCGIGECFVKTETILDKFRIHGPETVIDVAYGVKQTGDDDLNEEAFGTWFKGSYIRPKLRAPLTDAQVIQALSEYGGGAQDSTGQSLDDLQAAHPKLRVTDADRDALATTFGTYGWEVCDGALSLMEPLADGHAIAVGDLIRRLTNHHTARV